MKENTFFGNFLRGTACAAGIILIAAAAFILGNESALTMFAAAAAILYLCILLLRTPDPRSRRIRTITAILMYLPTLGICYLLCRMQPHLVLGNVVVSDLLFLMIYGLPAAAVLIGIASAYAAKQKTHPVIPVAVLYALYAAVQADAFRLALKDTLSSDPLVRLYYTQQARIGFFELCALAALHLAVIILLNRKIKAGEAAHPKLLTALAAGLCVYTAFIAATVLAQMTLYIRVRGLSERRLYASWVAVLLGIAFLVLLIRQFVRRLPSAAILAVCTAAVCGILYQFRPAARIAEYNIRRYESGSLDELDVPMLCTLSEDAYTVMAQHPDALKRAGQWDYYLEQAKSRTFSGKDAAV